jgi:two-component system LytT family response regulator
VRAFETSALDYLLKPIERERLDKTVDRVARRRDERAGGAPGAVDGDPGAVAGPLRAVLESLAQQLRGPAWLAHLASRIGDRVQLVGVDQVTHVVARHKATYAVTSTSEHMLDMTITDLETKLDPAKFIRIHRGTLVNVAWIGELHADFGGRLAIRLKDPRRTELGVSRDRVRPLKDRLGLA